MARPWGRPKARAKARARARASGLMCVKEGRPNVMLKENSERKIAAPGGTRTHNLPLSCTWLIFRIFYYTGDKSRMDPTGIFAPQEKFPLPRF